MPITHTSLRPLFPRRRLARAVWSKEAVQLAAGGVKRALLLLRAVRNERAAVITDHALEKPLRRYLPQRVFEKFAAVRVKLVCAENRRVVRHRLDR